MRIILTLLACLNIAVISAEDTEVCIPQTVLDFGFDGLLLLEDGSIWEVWGFDTNICFAKGDLVVVKGAYTRDDVGSDHEILVDGLEVNADLAGFLDSNVAVLNSYEFSVSNVSQDPPNLYGAISHLDDGNIMIGVNTAAFRLKKGQVVSVGSLDEVGCCLVDAENLTFINIGMNIGATLNSPLTRIVTEVTEKEYVFSDGFKISRTFDLGLSELGLPYGEFSVQFDPQKPLKVSIGITSENVTGNLVVDLSSELYVHADLEIRESNDWYEEDSSENYDNDEDSEEEDDYEENYIRNESITFVGSKSLKEALLPSSLVVGDTLSFYNISIPEIPEELCNAIYFAVKQ